jgi:hypothetical protein
MSVNETDTFGFTDTPPRAALLSHNDLTGEETPRLWVVPEVVGITFDGRVYHVTTPEGSLCGRDDSELYPVERWRVAGRWRPCEECFAPAQLTVDIPDTGEERDLRGNPDMFARGVCEFCDASFDDYMSHLLNECAEAP